MTGFEPLAAAATAGLTALVTDIIKGQGSGVLTRLLNQDIGKGMQQAYFDASKKYIQNYAERHGSLKVLGMREPVSLESVYTTVQVLDCEDRSFASVEDLEKSFREAQERRLRFAKESKQDGLAIANQKQYLMVLGAPGCGKSTFLRKLGLEALKGNRGGFKNHRCIPALLELKRFTEPKVDLKKLIAAEFEICGFPNAARFTQKALEQGRLLILLDGLDEVPAANRDAAIESIQDFVD
ncbi:MAG: NACHT domain-containing protein, partial [Phormidesmis sp. CAN_BIN44]|nr:NACHT domain-containing protein [Phormidesmis sp. CAN_BIN44]